MDASLPCQQASLWVTDRSLIDFWLRCRLGQAATLHIPSQEGISLRFYRHHIYFVYGIIQALEKRIPLSLDDAVDLGGAQIDLQTSAKDAKNPALASNTLLNSNEAFTDAGRKNQPLRCEFSIAPNQQITLGTARGDESILVAPDKRIKVSKLLQSRHIPPWRRRNYPIIFVDDTPVCLPGVLVAQTHGREFKNALYSLSSVGDRERQLRGDR